MPGLARESIQAWWPEDRGPKTLQQIEYEAILLILKSHQGTRKDVAKALGISIRTLRNKLNEMRLLGYEIPDPLYGFCPTKA